MVVVESTGTWEPKAATVLKHIARAVAARTGEEPDVVQASLLQELGVTVRSWRVRAALRRRSAAVA